jgi:hypothetical protein
MLKVIAVQDKDEQERLCGLCGTEYLPDALAYAGYDEDDFACVAQFSLKSGCAELYSLSPAAGAPENDDVMLLCGRAVLNFAYTLGSPTASCPMPDPERLPLYNKIGFRSDGGKMKADLKKLFSSHCN